MSNLKAVVEEGGGSLSDIVRINLQLKDASKNWNGYSSAYEMWWKEQGDFLLPTRSPTFVSEFPWPDVMVMMDAIAYIPKK